MTGPRNIIEVIVNDDDDNYFPDRDDLWRGNDEEDDEIDPDSWDDTYEDYDDDNEF